MKKLLTKQKINEGKITALGTQMVLIAQTTLKEIERLQKDIEENSKRLERLTQHVMHMVVVIEKCIWKVSNNANAIRFLAFIFISNDRHWNCLVYRQFQYHIIQIENLQMKIMPVHG